MISLKEYHFPHFSILKRFGPSKALYPYILHTYRLSRGVKAPSIMISNRIHVKSAFLSASHESTCLTCGKSRKYAHHKHQQTGRWISFSHGKPPQATRSLSLDESISNEGRHLLWIARPAQNGHVPPDITGLFHHVTIWAQMRFGVPGSSTLLRENELAAYIFVDKHGASSTRRGANM